MNLFNKLAVISLSVIASYAVALPDDWQKEMTILSDSAEIDRRAGTVGRRRRRHGAGDDRPSAAAAATRRWPT